MRHILPIVGLTVVVGLLVWLVFTDRYQDAPPPELAAHTIPIVGRDGYAQSAACKSCHPQHAESWHGSFHRTMTQLPTAESVVGDFADVSVEALGRRYKFTTDGTQFFVEMPDPDADAAALKMGLNPNDVVPAAKRCRVVMTTGSHHLQTYWVAAETDGNLLHQVPWVYHIDERRWIPNEESFVAPATTERRLFLNWNTGCVRCHAVAGSPEPTNDGWRTRVGDMSISCEACHGPGRQHVDYHDAIRSLKSSKIATADAKLFHPGKSDPIESAQACGQCHADVTFKSGHALGEFQPGDDFDACFNLNIGDRQRFWNDGSMRVAGREFIPISQSKCFSTGKLSCVSCHSMHDYASNDHQLSAQAVSNDACLNCHDSLRDNIAQHTHHAETSSGSRCVNCHMPNSTYGLFQATRSHQIDSPSADMTASFGRPNACNQCHTDKTLAWTAENLESWYGQARPKLSDKQIKYPATLLGLIEGDGALRTISAFSLAWPESLAASGNDWQTPFLAWSLRDDYASVRFVSHRSLKTFREFSAWKLSTLHGSIDSAESHRAIQIAAQRTDRIMPPAVRLLFNEDGTLDERLLEQLQADRDETPVLLTE